MHDCLNSPSLGTADQTFHAAQVDVYNARAFVFKSLLVFSDPATVLIDDLELFNITCTEVFRGLH